MAPCSPSECSGGSGVDRDLARMYKPKKHPHPQPSRHSPVTAKFQSLEATAATSLADKKKRPTVTIKDFRKKIDKVELMIKENVRLELELLDKAMELQKYRQKLSVKYEKYAHRLSEIKETNSDASKGGISEGKSDSNVGGADCTAGNDIADNEDDDLANFVPAKLPPTLRTLGKLAPPSPPPSSTV